MWLFCYNVSGRSWACIVVVKSGGTLFWSGHVLPLNYARMLPARLVVGEGATCFDVEPDSCE